MRLVTQAVSIVVLGLTLAAVAPAGADEPRQASGNFEGKKWTIEALGAYAFPAEEVGMDDKPGIRVAVSNSGFKAAAFDKVWDRRYLIDTFFKDDETLVVYFDFSPTGKYEGMSYYFGSGDGCGYCYSGGVQSTVKVEKGRIHGKLTQPPKDDDASFDISFDVPVASVDYGKPLAAGFGEQGKVYAAYHQALADSSPAALKPLLPEASAARLAESGDAILQGRNEDHPAKSYTITKGWVSGDRTLLLVEGESSYSKVKTEVHMVLEKGTWRVEDEILQVRIGED